MTRRGVLCLAGTPVWAALGTPLLFATDAEVARLLEFARKERAKAIESAAGKALKAGPWSVTHHQPTALNIPATANDFVSQAPYWWPDPANPKGPWIRRDGETNPNRFEHHRQAITAMSEAVLALALGKLVVHNDACAERAALVVHTWFVDPKTRMNPHVQFGEVIPGTNQGRGAGIIGTRPLLYVLQGVTLLESAGAFDAPVAAGLRAWSKEYLAWLTTSKHGLAERKTPNNHATWWTTLVASLAAFTGDRAILRECWDHFRNHLLLQIEPDGSCPKEETRTRSLDYSSMNLDAFALLCRLGGLHGVGLWRITNAKGGSVEKAVAYLAPYLTHPETWKQKQIRGFEPGSHWFNGIAALAFGSKPLYDAYGKIPRAGDAWIQFTDLLIRSNPVS